MLIDVAFNYEATIRRRRKRSDEDAIYRDSVPVQVAEPTASEAPVALRVADPDDYTSASRRMIELRWFDDRLWRAMEPSDHGEVPGVQRDAAWLVDASGQPNQEGNPLSAGPEPKHGTTKRIEDDVSVVRVSESVRDEVAAMVTARAADVMVLDGMVWKAVEEPYLSFDPAKGREVQMRLEWCDDDTPYDKYRLDEAHLIAPTHPDAFADGDGPEFPEFEILIPESLRLRTTEAAIAHAAKEHLGNTRHLLAENEVDYFLAFNTLKKAHAAFQPTLDAAADPDMGEILDALGDAVEAEKRRLASSWHGQVSVDPGIASALARIDVLGLDAEAFAGVAP